MSFDIDFGHSGHAGTRASNEDFAAVQRPAPADAALGWVAALADGVSTGGGGLLAAQTSVMSLVQDYFAAPPTWHTTVVLERLIRAQNTWLHEHNRRRAWARDAGTALTTLTALVLRGHSYTLAHVGDSRAWLWREGELTQLTHDHALSQIDLANTLTRALGLDEHVQIDFSQDELRSGDVLLLTSDGVHGPLARKQIAATLAAAADAQTTCDELVRRALAAGGSDNATALVLGVRGLDAGRYDDVLLAAHRLPNPPRLHLGSKLDGYTVTALVADTGVHRIVQARVHERVHEHVHERVHGRVHDRVLERVHGHASEREPGGGELVALKMLHESRAGDADERAMLSHEAWLGMRLGERLAHGEASGGSGGFVRVREARNASAFYVVFDWHGGRTLAQRLRAGERGTIADIVRAAIQIAKALGRAHRAGVVHRDIKPDNLHLGDDGVWRILDLGVAVSGREPKAQRSLHAGTPSYMNPEQWDDPPQPPDAGSDLYALGASLYQWLTGKLPYGEIEPFQRARFRRDPRPPSRLAPDVPIWLDHVVSKAVALDARQRFETAEELVLALERGAVRALPAPHATPLAQRDPAALWRVGFGLSVLLNALLVFWLLFLPR